MSGRAAKSGLWPLYEASRRSSTEGEAGADAEILAVAFHGMLAKVTGA